MIALATHVELMCHPVLGWGQWLRSKEGSMGYELRRRLRNVLGPEITGLQRAVALEIADDANDETRESWASLEDLARWTAAKNTAVVRDALKRLAAAGWEFRVAIRTGKDGRALYAVPGKRMTFLVPDFKEGVTAPCEGARTPSEGATTPSEGAAVPPSNPQERATTPSKGATTPSEDAGAPSEGAGATPSSSAPQPLTSSASQQEEPAEQRHAYGIPDQARPLVDALTAAGVLVRWPFQGNQWLPLLGLIQKSGVPAMVDHAVRASARRDGDVDSAKFFMKGWRELPPLPPPGQGTFLLPIEGGGEGAAPPRRRAASGGHQPFQAPPESAYLNDQGF